MINILFECSPIDPTTGVTTTYRFARLQADASGTQLNNVEWEPAITALPVMTMSVFSRGQVQAMSVDHGSIGINLDASTTHLSQLVWDGALGRVWIGRLGQPFETYKKAFDGTLGAHSREGSTLKIPLYGIDFRLNETPILSARYAGTGGVEGPVSLRGTWKPRAYGSCRYVEPVRVSEAYVVFQVHDGACYDIPAVYENALSLGAPGATAATYDELIGLSLKPGEWAKAPAIGMYRLGGEPSGLVSADVQGDATGGSTLSAITAAILARAGVSATDIHMASIDAVASTIQWNVYLTDQAMVGDTLKAAFAGAGLYIFADEAGVMRAGSWLASGAALDASTAGPDLHVIAGSLKQEEASPPNYSVTINAERCWTIHSDKDISPAIAELQEGQKALEDEAKDQSEKLAQTRADVTIQARLITNISDDGVLDNSEKAQIKLTYASIVSNKPTLVSKATGFKVSTTEYVAAFDNLTAYLASLTPAWDDTTQPTNITRSDFDGVWSKEFVAREQLARAIADATAKLANWSGVEDRPDDLLEFDPIAGQKVESVAWNADVTKDNTAKDTTHVGGRPAGDIVAGIDKLPDIRADIDKALAAGQAVADREQAAATPPGNVSNIVWSSVLTDIGADVTLTWTAAKDATSYEVELGENGGGGIVFAAPATSYRFAAKRNTAYSARIRALKINVPSGWVSAPNFTTGRDTVAPAAPTALSASPGITWIDVATVAPADADQAKIRFTLYRSGDNAKIGEATVSATASTRAETRFGNLSRMAAYYVSAVAIDSSDNVSPATANVSVATINTSIDDLTPGLVPPQTVTSLPNPSGWTGSPVVFFAGELYRLVNGAWTKSVNGSDITASSIATDKLVNDAVTTDKLAANAVSTSNLVDAAVSGSKIAASAITADKIAANAITANRLTAANRPVSVFGTRFRVDNDGYLRWGSGYIQYTSDNGNYTSTFVSGNELAPQPYTNYVFYTPDGRNYFDYTSDENILNNQNVIMIGRWHGNKEGFVPLAGAGTLINGDQIVTGSIYADRIRSRSIGADQITTGSITANEIATNTITANRLSIATRPFSIYGTRFWVDTSGVLQWTSGYVQYAASDGGYRSEQVGGGSRSPGGVWYIFFYPGSGGFSVTSDETIQRDQAAFFVGKWHSDKSGPILAGGVGTLINGDQIVTGSVNANKIIARTITADQLAANSVTANEIAAGTITAAQIATSALTARVLAVGNPDNIIGDSGYNDASWWNGGNADGRLTVGESGMIETGRELKVTSSGRSDFYSMFFPVELGATYRVSVGVYTYGDFNGRFRPVIHMPNWAWLNLKAGTGVDPEDSNPSLNWTSASSYFRNEFVVTNPANTLECKKWQFRLIGDWSGTLAFVCKIVRVSDTTLIKDGAITTDKITVNSLNGDRITAGTLNADKIAANTVLSNSVWVGNVDGGARQLETIVQRSNNPAARVNEMAGITNITPGAIQISGDTTLANWRQGGDDTRIAGGSISANTISANKLTIGNRAISFIGLNFEWNPANNWVSWSSGYIYYQDDNGSPRAQFINSGNTGGVNPHRFFFWIKDGASIYHTQSEQEAFGGTDRVMLGSWWGGSDLNMTYGGTIINGDRITTGSIDANRIKANTVLANTVIVGGRGTVDSAFDSAKWNGISGDGKPADNATVGAPSGTYVGNSLAQTVESWANTGAQDPAGRINAGTTTISGGKITTGSITANQIAANTITADRLNVTSLSALSANIGDVTAGVVRNASGSAKFDLTAGRIVFDNGSVMKVSGNGFGSSSQFIEWFGPRKNSLSECTEQNASYYLKTDGSSYFGGSLSAGTIKNAIGTTSTATNANVTTGTVGSRGGTRVVVLSYSWSWYQRVDKYQTEASGNDLSAQIILSRNGTDIATLNASGSWDRDPAYSADEPGDYREAIGGSLTFTDNSGGSSVTYSARLTSRNTGPGPQSGSSQGGTATQNISIVQTEQ